MKALFIAVLFLATVGTSEAANYQDWWFNSNLTGMGINLAQQNENIFGTWYMYDELGNPSFLLFYGDLVDNSSLTAELRRFYGSEPPVYDESVWYGEVVGTVTIDFNSPFTGNFNYQYDGKSGAFSIQRYGFREINLSGQYIATEVGSLSGCEEDGSYLDLYFISLTHNGSDLSGTVEYTSSDEVAQIVASTTQHGSLFAASGSISNAEGSRDLTLSNIRLVDGFMMFDFLMESQDTSCLNEGKVSGVLLSRPMAN